jgi:hypothetical protein
VFAVFASIGLSMPIQPDRSHHINRIDLSDFLPVLFSTLGGLVSCAIMSIGMFMISKEANQKINYLSNEKKQLQLNRSKAIKQAM